MRLSPLRLLIILLLVSPSIFGQETGTDQRQYNLFHPTPRNQMREFSIDRPDITESPISVDPGHFQFEGDMFKITWDDRGRGDRSVSYMNALYKMGLTHSWDIHIGLEMYAVNYEGNEVAEQGYGTTTIRLKHNLWGNDGGTKTALGMIPYCAFSPDGDVTYGAGFPFSVGLSDKLDLGAQPQFDFIPSDNGHDLSYFQTIVLGGPLIGKFDFYVEGWATFYLEDQFYSGNCGLIYNPVNNVKIDLATNVGLNDGTPTRVFMGLSFRI